MINHQSIIDLIADVPMRHGRRIIAIAGAPASGKSTLAHDLHTMIHNSCVVPMDGFHRDNDDLAASGLLSRKGAPETFDVLGFKDVVRQLHSSQSTSFPTFDRRNDCVVPGGGQVKDTDETVLIEGNYLLLDRPEWDHLQQFWDFSILLDLSFETLKSRLVDRWLTHGFDLAEATQKAEQNDLPNARLIIDNVLPLDLKVDAG